MTRRDPSLAMIIPVVGGMLAALPIFAQTAALPPSESQLQPALTPIQSVAYDNHGAFRVNDKPFFPIALYDAPLDDATLRELRDFGFNVLVCDAKSSASLREKGFYAACHADSRVDDLSGVFLGIGIDSPALNFKKDLLRQTAEFNAKTRVAVPGRPVMNAIGYWEDEPEGVANGKLPSKATYEDLVAAIDVSAPYLYPVPYQPVSSVGEAVSRAREASAGRKPLLPVLQLFAWNAKDRYPTPAELRCMAFLALVEGAQGVSYYSYGSVTGRPGKTIAAAQPELWASVRSLNNDLADVGPRLLAGKGSGDVALGEGAPSVKMKVVREENGLFAVLVNGSTMPQSAKLIRKADIFDRIERRNGEVIPIQDGTATLRLEPFHVEILRFKVAFR